VKEVGFKAGVKERGSYGCESGESVEEEMMGEQIGELAMEELASK